VNAELEYGKSPLVLSKEMSMAWVKNSGFKEDCLSWTSEETFSIEFTVPNEVFKVQALCTELSSWIGEPNEWMVWIKSWPFYKPEEMAVIQAMRRGWGVQKKLIDAPGHVFQHKNSEALGLFMLTLLFGWDAMFAPVPSNVAVITYAHEGLGTVITKSKELSSVIKKKMEELEIAGW
jgi:hypothetical protein